MRDRDRDRPRDDEGGTGGGGSERGRGPRDRGGRWPGGDRGGYRGGAGQRGGQADRPFRPRFDRPGGGGPRPSDRRPDRPSDRRPDRPSDRRPDRPFDRRPDRPYRPREDRPFEDRAPADRPYEQRPYEDRPRPADRPFERRDRPAGPRPQRPFERSPERPFRPPPARATGPATADRTDLLAEGEEVVAGRRPVSEAFAARRAAKRLLVVPDRRAALESLVLHATTLRLPIVEVEGGTLTSLTGFDGHQGVALVVGARPSASVQDILARALARGEPPFVLVLDSLEDPQNLGTLLRSAEACGVHGVIYPSRRAAPLTAAAIKASAGASEHLLLASVDNLAGTLVDLRAAGLRLAGADEGAPLRYAEADLRGPLALVVGSEERGISGALRRRLDVIVRIPMRGRVASLNAAVAGSVLLFAAAEQRGLPEVGDRPLEALPDEQPAAVAADTAAEADAAAAEADTAVEATTTDELLPGEPPALPDEA